MELSHAKIFLSQNDGTLVNARFAMENPVYTFSSGPTNSLRGASLLTQVKNGIVIDIGGTTTDVSALVSGFPRPASAYVKIGGVRTKIRMPDTISVPLGGGSIVKFDNQGNVSIGPQSVGFELKR